MFLFFYLFQALNSGDQPKSRASPEDLVRCTKAITHATAKAVAAGNSCKQDDIIVAANMGRKAISDMLTICKVIMIDFNDSEINVCDLLVEKNENHRTNTLVNLL